MAIEAIAAMARSMTGVRAMRSKTYMSRCKPFYNSIMSRD